MADDFDFYVHSIKPEIPQYNVLHSDYEGWKRKSRLKSSLPIRKWQIEIRGQTNSEKDLIVAHWDSCSGTVEDFTWNVLPSIWNTGYGTSYQVQYESMDYSNPEQMANIWNFVIVFREYL
jgi:hypothetical protein